MDNSRLKEAFLKAYDSHADGLFRFCFLRTKDRELAKDLVQEVFMRTWIYIEKGHELTNTKAFLYRVATNLVIDWYRKSKSESLDVLLEKGFEPAAPKSNIVEESEVSRSLNLLKKLDVTDQHLILWKYVEGLSVKDIADILKERSGTVSVRLHRAMKRLRRLLNEGQKDE